MQDSENYVQTVGDKTLAVEMKNGRQNGVMSITNRSGVKEVECLFKDGNLNGPYKQFYSNGNIMSIINYVFGKKDGPFTVFYESGVRQITGIYKDDLYHGVVTEYDEFGDEIRLSPYVNGRLQGKVVSFYSKNQMRENHCQVIMEIAFYENGLLNGNKVLYNIFGEIISITPYKNGRPLRYSLK